MTNLESATRQDEIEGGRRSGGSQDQDLVANCARFATREQGALGWYYRRICSEDRRHDHRRTFDYLQH